MVYQRNFILNYLIDGFILTQNTHNEVNSVRFLDRLKYSLAMLRKGPKYQMTLFTTMNRRFWNNGEKIIGWTQGYPVVSLLSPPSFHPAQAYAMTTKIQSLFQGRPLPDMANISPGSV